ncbi:hypothetical protein [Nocardia nova]|uniref:hypothetical protein n=1 Tax=Nocardia nova TaxID=37330 RepID=UPI0033D36EA0
MGSDRFSARLRLSPRHRRYLHEADRPHTRVVVAGFHHAHRFHPLPGTVVAPLPGIDLARSPGESVMVVVRLDWTRRVIVADIRDGLAIRWIHTTFPRFPNPTHWYLTPATADADTGRLIIGPGGWAAGARQALLPPAVLAAVPGAPPVVSVHDLNTHTGHRWNT